MRNNFDFFFGYLSQKRTYSWVNKFEEGVGVNDQQPAHPHWINVAQLKDNLFDSAYRQWADTLVLHINDKHVVLKFTFDEQFLHDQINHLVYGCKVVVKRVLFYIYLSQIQEYDGSHAFVSAVSVNGPLVNQLQSHRVLSLNFWITVPT